MLALWGWRRYKYAAVFPITAGIEMMTTGAKAIVSHIGGHVGIGG